MIIFGVEQYCTDGFQADESHIRKGMRLKTDLEQDATNRKRKTDILIDRIFALEEENKRKEEKIDELTQRLTWAMRKLKYCRENCPMKKDDIEEKNSEKERALICENEKLKEEIKGKDQRIKQLDENLKIMYMRCENVEARRLIKKGCYYGIMIITLDKFLEMQKLEDIVNKQNKTIDLF